MKVPLSDLKKDWFELTNDKSQPVARILDSARASFKDSKHQLQYCIIFLQTILWNREEKLSTADEFLTKLMEKRRVRYFIGKKLREEITNFLINERTTSGKLPVRK